MSEEEILKIACTNSYRVIILQEDWVEIFGEKHNYFAHNPVKAVVDMETVDNLLIYFNEIEDFEKCAMIRDYKMRQQN